MSTAAVQTPRDGASLCSSLDTACSSAPSDAELQTSSLCRVTSDGGESPAGAAAAPADLASHQHPSAATGVAGGPPPLMMNTPHLTDEGVSVSPSVDGASASPSSRKAGASTADPSAGAVESTMDESTVAKFRSVVLHSEECWREALTSAAPPAEPVTNASGMARWLPANCDNAAVMSRFIAAAAAPDGNLSVAALQFTRFVACVREVGMADQPTLDTPPAAADAVVRSGAWHVLDRPDALGRPVMFIFARRVDWKTYGVPEMKAACVYYLWKLCTARGHGGESFVAQRAGVLCCLFLRDMSATNARGEYNRFAQGLVSHALPMRIADVFVADAPFIVRRVMWPVVTVVISAKMRKRVAWLSATPSEVPTPQAAVAEPVSPAVTPSVPPTAAVPPPLESSSPSTPPVPTTPMPPLTAAATTTNGGGGALAGAVERRPYAQLHALLPASRIPLECGGEMPLPPPPESSAL